MNENIKNLNFKLIMENNDGLSKKKACGKTEVMHGANFVSTKFKAKNYIIKDINKSKKIKKYKYKNILIKNII